MRLSVHEGAILFQSTPVITDGRAKVARGALVVSTSFNPRPSSLTGEPPPFMTP